MQIQNPSPCEGFFEPAVSLGQRVAAGEPLGRVSDVLGKRVMTVSAQTPGIVLTLRTCPRVQAGDSLAVILEIGAAAGARA
jgi:predicted deacylase